MHYLGGVMDSPVGRLLLLGDTRGILRRIEFWQTRSLEEVEPVFAAMGHQFTCSHEAVADVVHQLEQYFCGERTRFELQIEPEGTDFQRMVWSALVRIPFGVCRTYTDLADLIDRPKSIRAVGAANGANPIPIVIPCHRVIGRSGRLTGYRGGLRVKADLLRHEGFLMPE